MNKLFLLVLLIAGAIRLQASVSPAKSDLDLLRNKVKAELMTPAVHETEIRELMRTIQPEGTWPDANRAFGTATLDRLLLASDYRKDELETIRKIRQGASLTVASSATFFWDSEYFTFQRPDFFTSVRMYSNRDYNMEQPYNGEGLMNHHRGDGTNYISRTGNEYDGLAPVNDWQKIPGATIVQKPALPSEKEIQKKGLTVADPSRKLSRIHLFTNIKIDKVGADFKSIWNAKKGVSEIAIDLPQTVYAGKSVTIEL